MSNNTNVEKNKNSKKLVNKRKRDKEYRERLTNN